MTARYINPYTDFGFKKLFGEEGSKNLLIDFLNSVLPEASRIQSLTFKNLEGLPDSENERRAVFDIACRSESGEEFIVEMQKAKQHYFKDRSLFYSTFPIRGQAQKGDWDWQLKKVYFVGILDFEYDEQEEKRKFLREVSLKDQDGDNFSDKLNFIFLQMPLFNQTEAELVTHKDKWFYFLKHLEDFDQLPAILRDEVFEQASALAEYHNLSRNDQALYERDLRNYRDNYAIMQTAKNDSYAEGKAEGKAEGQSDAIILVLQARFQTVPAAAREQLSAITAPEKLAPLTSLAATCATLDEFIAALQ
ncbi:hypothetical protein AGMMS49959_00830 [Planctomycetales bacterium]|nr:hypothetical protein AGMMS49959_00830 [Planctomycetales bacterium]